MGRHIEPERVSRRIDVEAADARYVLYWMHAAQRAQHNQALEYSIQRANGLGVPVAVVFCVDTTFPDASARHFVFMFEGLD